MAHHGEHLEEFFDQHRKELQQAAIARTSLFSEYVAFCNERDYRHHSNLIQFCKEMKRRTAYRVSCL